LFQHATCDAAVFSVLLSAAISAAISTHFKEMQRADPMAQTDFNETEGSQ
jgi:hypothetical protein